MRSISLYCSLFSDAVLDGLQQEAISSGVDLGEAPDAGDEVSTVFEVSEGAEKSQPGANETGQEQPAES